MVFESATSKLAARLAAGEFVITAEIAPPHGTDTGRALGLARLLASHVHALNITDNQNAHLRLSSLALAHVLIENGHEVVFQLTCRDRNRLALQSDLLGAWALGVRNVLALTGDHIASGDHPESRPVFDLDAVNLLATISTLNEGRDLVGKTLKGPTGFFAGAALAVESQPLPLALSRFRKKIRAGARFFQTQAVFNPHALAPFRETAEGEGAHIIAGVLLLHSLKMIDYINRKVPGLTVPGEIAGRIAHAQDPLDAALDEAARTVRACRELGHGVHLMAAGKDELIPEILSRAGLGTPIS